MFQRKKPETPEPKARDRRSAYRRPQTQAHRLTISLRDAKGTEIPGSFQDLSLGGASARFPGAAPLARNQQVVLTIGSLTHAAKVIAEARVAFCMDVKGGRLCGFQFTDLKALTPQIDDFYVRFFNRRRSPRVGTPLDKKIKVHLSLGGQELVSEMVDISLEGMQVRLLRSLAKPHDGTAQAEVRFSLPGHKEEIRGHVRILRRTLNGESMTLGLGFDLTQENGLATHRAAIGSWIVHRTHEIAKWDNSLTKPEAA